MAEADDQNPQNLASHTLAYLRRIDRRMDEIDKRFIQIVDILSRQATKGDRGDRNNGEAFERIERDLREIKSDAILSENRILSRMNEAMELSHRLSRHDERLETLEGALQPSPSPQ